jgi:protein SCO1/2
MFATLAFVGGALLGRVLQPSTPARPVVERATLLPGGPPLPRLDLVDEEGRPFDGTGLRGHWTYVFFGFTSCPDICPTTLATLAGVHRALADLAPALQPQFLLVTVDPARDDATRLEAYVRYYDPQFHALTGRNAAIDQLAGALGAAYARVEQPGGGYTMDHSAGLYLVGPRGRLVATTGAPHDAAVIARDYRAILAAGTD